MRNVKVYTREGGAPDKEELAAALIAVTAFRDKAVGIFPYTHNGIGVEYHPHKLIAYVQGNSSIYFGASQSVDMRCKCRGVILAETKAAAEPTATFRVIQSSDRLIIVEVSILDHKGNVVSVTQGTQTIVGGEFPTYTGASVTISNLPFIYTPPGVASALTNVPLEFQLASGVITNLGQPNEVRSGTAFEVSPTYQSLIEAAAAEANQRSAVYLTDGSELVSAPRNTPISNPNDWQYNILGSTTWRGDGSAPLFDFDGSNRTWNRVPDLIFTVPYDVCYQKASAPPYPGTSLPSITTQWTLGFINTTTITISGTGGTFIIYGTQTGTDDIGNPQTFNRFLEGGSGSQATPTSRLMTGVWNARPPAFDARTYETLNTTPEYIAAGQLNSTQQAWITDWNAAQTVAITREHARRKKCSDGQMAYLRNGFMSPEVERFVKAYHPVSNLLRRDIPMQIISEPVHTLINEEYDSDGERIAATYECKLTLMYIVDATKQQKEFIGQVRFTEFTATYTNYPLLGSFLNGAATPVYDEFRAAYDRLHVELMCWIYRSAELGIVHDESSNSLFCEVSGTFTFNNRWYDEFYDSGPTPSIGYFSGETVKTSFAGLTLSYPQFLLDYMAASKPIETEIDENGNKVPVTPSTDWLSSRLTDKEVIKVVPLNHVGNSYGNYGMFPLMQRIT